MDNQPNVFQWLKKILFPEEEASTVKPEQDNVAKPETENTQASAQSETSAESGKMPREQYEKHSESFKRIINQKETLHPIFVIPSWGTENRTILEILRKSIPEQDIYVSKQLPPATWNSLERYIADALDANEKAVKIQTQYREDSSPLTDTSPVEWTETITCPYFVTYFEHNYGYPPGWDSATFQQNKKGTYETYRKRFLLVGASVDKSELTPDWYSKTVDQNIHEWMSGHTCNESHPITLSALKNLRRPQIAYQQKTSARRPVIAINFTDTVPENITQIKTEDVAGDHKHTPESITALTQIRYAFNQSPTYKMQLVDAYTLGADDGVRAKGAELGIPKETIEEVIAEFKSLERPSDAMAAIQIPIKRQNENEKIEEEEMINETTTAGTQRQRRRRIQIQR